MRLVREEPKFFTIVGSGEGTQVLTLRALQTSRVRRIEHIRRTGGESPEVPKFNLGRRSEDARELSRPSDLRYSQPDVDHFGRTEVW
jgi:hypothetical protein